MGFFGITPFDGHRFKKRKSPLSVRASECQLPKMKELVLFALSLLAVALVVPISDPRKMESITASPAVSVDGGAAAPMTEENAVAEMAIGTDNASPVDLGAGGDFYSCKDCRAHLALAADIVSKDFLCKHGKAYLFDKVVNVTVGVKEDRLMLTGLHTVSDIFCGGCGAIVGWKYEVAHEKSQRYKEGKYILERHMLLGPDGSHYSPARDAIDN